MEEVLNHIIIFPLRNALIRLINFNPLIDDKRLLKDDKLLYYFYFLEVFQSSQILGSLTRQVMTGKVLKGQSQSQPIGNPEHPSELPKNVQTMEGEHLVDQFKEPEAFNQLEEMNV
jgi:hypothetical protein